MERTSTPRAGSLTVRCTSPNAREAKNPTSAAPSGIAPVSRALRPSTVGISASVARGVPWSGKSTANGAGSPSKRTRTRRSNSRRSRATRASNSSGGRLSSVATSSASSVSYGAPSASASRSATRLASNVPPGCSVSVAAVNSSGWAAAGDGPTSNRTLAANAEITTRTGTARRRRTTDTTERIARAPSARRHGVNGPCGSTPHVSPGFVARPQQKAGEICGVTAGRRPRGR